jgi:hypothetical protein
MASVLVEKQISAVLDVSEFTTAETKRFVRDFAEAFFQAKKKSKSPVHVFWEEAQTFAPQTPEKDEGVMLNRVERLLKLGRNYGVGWSLITQQPQAVHKRVLNQAGTVLAHRTIGSHEKKAIIAWVSDKVTKAEELSLVDTLPGLDTGMAHLWSPSFLKVSRTVKVNRKLTFDSSATPEFGEEFVEPKRLAAVDVAKLRESLKSMVEDAEKADPDFLKRRILQLEGELKSRPTETKVQIKEVVKEVPVLTEKQLKRLEKAAEKLAGAAADTKDAAQSIARSIGRPHVEPAMPAFNPHEVIGPGLYPPHNPMPPRTGASSIAGVGEEGSRAVRAAGTAGDRRRDDQEGGEGDVDRSLGATGRVDHQAAAGHPGWHGGVGRDVRRLPLGAPSGWVGGGERSVAEDLRVRDAVPGTRGPIGAGLDSRAGEHVEPEPEGWREEDAERAGRVVPELDDARGTRRDG